MTHFIIQKDNTIMSQVDCLGEEREDHRKGDQPGKGKMFVPDLTLNAFCILVETVCKAAYSLHLLLKRDVRAKTRD